jgi:HEPN domain-containing protein
MAKTPRHSVEVHRFQHAAAHRFEEAQFLLERGGYTTAAVYLAGYAVECSLKALLLSTMPLRKQREALGSFRGAKAHDFGWLKHLLGQQGVVLPRTIATQLATLAWWDTDLRYDAKMVEQEEAEEFLAGARLIVGWANGRL